MNWSSAATVEYGFLVAATPILCYIIFNWEHYTYYESTFIDRFLGAARGIPFERYAILRHWSLELFFSRPRPSAFLAGLFAYPTPVLFLLDAGINLSHLASPL